MSKKTTAKKRIGRPTKPPVEGARVSLGFRVTAEVKRKLEAAAIKKGRSISQEAEIRLEQSLATDKHLTMSRAGEWAPVLFGNQTMIIYVGEWEIVSIPITTGQRDKLMNAFDPVRMATEWAAEEEAEAATRKAELIVEARHLSGNPNLSVEEALAYLDLRGNDQAHVMLIDLIAKRGNAEATTEAQSGRSSLAKRLKAEQLRRQAATPEPKMAKK